MSNYLMEGQETARLRFRRLKPEDFATWLKFFEHPLWNKYWKVEPATPAGFCKDWFDKAFYRYEHDLGGMNVLVDKKTGAFIGQCGLLVQTVDDLEELEIAYSILPEFWNQGYATEAAKKCMEVAFGNNFRDSLISIIHVNNAESARVAMKNGMEVEKRTIYDNNPVNIYRLTKEAWLRNQPTS